MSYSVVQTGTGQWCVYGSDMDVHCGPTEQDRAKAEKLAERLNAAALLRDVRAVLTKAHDALDLHGDIRMDEVKDVMAEARALLSRLPEPTT